MTKKDYSTNIAKNIIASVSANNGYFISNFLNPFEQNLWQKNFKDVNLHFWGGYDGAERKIVLITSFSHSYSIDVLKDEIVVLETKTNSFVQITHRQILGTLMHSGFKRDVIGDIIIDHKKVQIIVKRSIAKFFMDNPLDINHHFLHFKKIGSDQVIKLVNNFSTLVDTVPSLRIDACLAKMLKTSRSVSQNLIQEGKVFVNFQEVNKIAFVLTENEMITVRGFGRMKINRVIGRSKKGKIVIEYQKV